MLVADRSPSISPSAARNIVCGGYRALRALSVLLVAMVLAGGNGCRRSEHDAEETKPAIAEGQGQVDRDRAARIFHLSEVTLTGRVTNEEGQRLADALVELRSGSAVLSNAKTNKDGTFRLVILPGTVPIPMSVALRVTFTGHATRIESLRLGTGSVALKPIRLASEVEAEGRVVDQEGTPVAGAKIAAMQGKEWLPLGEGTADEEGRFSIPGLGPGKYPLRIEAFGFRSRAQVTLSAPGPRVTIKLERTYVINGQVLAPGGVPIAEARIFVVAANAQPPAAVHVWSSDARGHYAMDGLLPGVYLVWGQKGDRMTYPPMKVSIEAEDPEPVSVDLALEHQSATVRGELIDVEGHPVNDARVELRPRWPLALPIPMGGETDQGGKFTVPSLTPGRYEIAAWRGAQPLTILEGPRAVQVSVEPGEQLGLEPIKVRFRHE